MASLLHGSERRAFRLEGRSSRSASAEYDPCFHRARLLRSRPPGVRGPVLRPPCIRQRRVPLNRSAATADRWATRRRSTIDDRPDLGRPLRAHFSPQTERKERRRRPWKRRVSADPVAKPAAHTRAESRGSGPSKVDAGERQTLRWREVDSNLYGAFRVKWSFWVCCSSLFGAGKAVLRLAARPIGSLSPRSEQVRLSRLSFRISGPCGDCGSLAPDRPCGGAGNAAPLA